MSLLNTLTEQGRIWTAKHWQETQIPAIRSGVTTLDALLPGGGWPLGAITEILYDQRGSGELRLLLPALARLSTQDQRWQLWLNPPLQPCAPALQQWQLDTERVLLTQAKNTQDICYCLEKSLNSGGCQGAVAWLGKLDKALMRRIQLAAEQAQVPVFMLRPSQFQNQPSIAALRLHLHVDNRLDILKRRAGWPVEDLRIDLPLYPSAVMGD